MKIQRDKGKRQRMEVVVQYCTTSLHVVTTQNQKLAQRSERRNWI